MAHTIPEPTGTHYLQLAREAARFAELAGRTNEPVEEMQFAMLYALLASAEAATRQAIALEDMQEFLAEFVGGTNITSALVAWGERR